MASNRSHNHDSRRLAQQLEKLRSKKPLHFCQMLHSVVDDEDLRQLQSKNRSTIAKLVHQAMVEWARAQPDLAHGIAAAPAAAAPLGRAYTEPQTRSTAFSGDRDERKTMDVTKQGGAPFNHAMLPPGLTRQASAGPALAAHEDEDEDEGMSLTPTMSGPRAWVERVEESIKGTLRAAVLVLPDEETLRESGRKLVHGVQVHVPQDADEGVPLQRARSAGTPHEDAGAAQRTPAFEYDPAAASDLTKRKEGYGWKSTPSVSVEKLTRLQTFNLASLYLPPAVHRPLARGHEPGDELTLSVVHPRHELRLQLTFGSTLLALKQQIEAETRIPVGEQTLRLDVRLLRDGKTLLDEEVPPHAVLELQVGKDYDERHRRNKVQTELWQARYSLDKSVGGMIKKFSDPKRTSRRSFVALIRKEREELDERKRERGMMLTEDMLAMLERIDRYTNGHEEPAVVSPTLPTPKPVAVGGTHKKVALDGVLQEQPKPTIPHDGRVQVTFRSRSDGRQATQAFALESALTELYIWASAHFGAASVVLKTGHPPSTIPQDAAQLLETQHWVRGLQALVFVEAHAAPHPALNAEPEPQLRRTPTVEATPEAQTATGQADSDMNVRLLYTVVQEFLRGDCEALQAGGAVHTLVKQAGASLGWEASTAEPVHVLLSQLVAGLLPELASLLGKSGGSYYVPFTYDAARDCFRAGPLSRSSSMSRLFKLPRAELLQDICLRKSQGTHELDGCLYKFAVQSFDNVDLAQQQAAFRREHPGQPGPCWCFPFPAIKDDRFEYDARRDRLVLSQQLTADELATWRREDFCSQRCRSIGGLLYTCALASSRGEGLRGGILYTFPYEQIEGLTFSYDGQLDVLTANSGIYDKGVVDAPTKRQWGEGQTLSAPSALTSEPTGEGDGATPAVAEGLVEQLVQMGYAAHKARIALVRNASDIAAAVEYLSEHDIKSDEFWEKAPELSAAEKARQARLKMFK